MRRPLKFCAAALLLTVPMSCRTTSSQVLDRPPSVDGQAVPQGGPPVANNCNRGGHEGPTEGTGWPFNPNEGCFVHCPNWEAAEADFLDQLRHHRVFGNLDMIRAKYGEDAFNMADHFWKKLEAQGRRSHSFRDEDLKDKIFDGSNWRNLGIQVGDVIMNFNFGQPNHAGIFYSKRGISHARLVVKVTDNEIHTLDGGWEHYSVLDQINSQMVWMRPKNLSAADRRNIQRWAKLFEPVAYDNLLVDDWAIFRFELHRKLKDGMAPEDALDAAFRFAAANGGRPTSKEDTFNYLPASGLYCSEGTAAIYSYLGINQYGETPIQVATAFSPSGDLPDWDLYADALSGFGASGDPKVFMMHNLFYSYFEAFEEAKKAGLINLEGVGNLKEKSFAEAAMLNLAHVDKAPDQNHLIKQLTDLRPVFEKLPEDRRQETIQKLDLLVNKLAEVTGSFNEKTREPAGLPNLNESQVLANIFYKNMAYGPQTFFENAEQFDFMGVFYNRDTSRRGNQALFIGNWYNSVIENGQPRLYRANIQTTLYKVVPSAFPEGSDTSKCVVGDKAPLQMRGD